MWVTKSWVNSRAIPSSHLSTPVSFVLLVSSASNENGKAVIIRFTSFPKCQDCIFGENSIVITYLYNNSLRNSIFLEKETILCYWELIFASKNLFKLVFLVRNLKSWFCESFLCISLGTAVLTFKRNIYYCYFEGFMYFIEILTLSYI